LLEWADSRMPTLRCDNDTLVQKETPKVVVLMNVNARGVSNRSISVAQEIFGADAVYSTATPDDVYQVLQTAVGASPYSTTPSATINKNSILVVMGGDGTLSFILQTLCEILRASSSSSLEEALFDLPLIAYIPMGTGNAVGSVVGCHYNPQMDSTWRRSPRSRFEWLGFGPRRAARFRATLQQLRDGLLRRSPPPAISQGSIVELPILEITTTSPTRSETSSSLCFFAGGTSWYLDDPVDFLGSSSRNP
jgi:Diacylglycerol kinase catalytic domain